MRQTVLLYSEEDVYVTFSSLSSVYKYTNNGSLIAIWTNIHSPTHRDGFINVSLETPTDIAVDENRDVYILDLSKLGVQKFNSNGTLLTRWAVDYSTDDETRRQQHSIAVDKEGNVYEIGPGDAIQKFSSNGTLITRLGKPVSHGIKNNEFLLPSGLAVDEQDNVYIGDIGTFRIQKYSSNGTFITGWKTYSDDINEAVMQAIPQSMHLAVDHVCNIFVADGGWCAQGITLRNSSIQKFSSNGTLLTGFTKYNKDNDKAFFPTGIDVDKQDNVYVSSTNPDLPVVKVSNNGTFIAGFSKR